MTKSFKVAGHCFNFDLPASDTLWDRMGQYSPFAVEHEPSPLFSIRLVDSLPEVPMEKVYGGGEGPGEPVIMLYRTPGGWVFETSPFSGQPVCARIHADASFSDARLQILQPSFRLFSLNNAAMLMFAFSTAPLGTLEMHASVIENGGRAFLWLAKSGTGKSTHSQLWLKHIPGSRLLNDDNPIVRLNPDGTPEVYGSPWSGKTPCYINRHCPAGAFVQIRRSPENRIERLGVFESYAMVFSSSSGLKTDPAMADHMHSTFEKIATTVPCYNLFCRPDEEAARVCAAELLGK